MFRFKLTRAVLLAAVVFVAVQLYFIFTSKIGEIGPLSQADKNLVFQGHDNKNSSAAFLSELEPELNETSQDKSQPLQLQPTPSQDPKGQFAESTKQSNTGNVAVGFGENAPQNVPTRVGMPQVNNSSSIFVGSAPPAAKKPSSGTLHLKSALGNNSNDSKKELSPADSAQLTMQMAQAHLSNLPSSNKSATISPGHSDQYMQMLQKNSKQRVNNDYERCLIAIMLLEKAGGELALSQIQARYVLKLIEEAENGKYAESQANEKIAQLLSKEQKLYINKSISRKPLYANGPVEDDPTQASLKKAIEALEKAKR